MATNRTPQQIAEKWQRNLSQSEQDIRAGVQAVQVAPGVAAAAQKDKYVRRVIEKQDKWAERVAAVPLQTWKDMMLNKGLQRIGTGAQAAVPKFAAFMGEFMAYQRNTVLPELARMPKGTLEDGVARATFVIRANAQFRQLRQGGTFVPFGRN